MPHGNLWTTSWIDHICISSKFRRSWWDAQVMRDADVSSDHHLLMTTVRLHLKRFITDKVQCWTAQSQGHTSSFPDQPFQQVPAATRADGSRWDGLSKHNRNTARSSGTTHVKRSLARRRHSTRNGSLPTQSTSWKQGERGKLCWTTAEQEKGTGTGRVHSNARHPIRRDRPSWLRTGKAAGPDEIPAEAIKSDIETAINMLYSLFSKIWVKDEVPDQWKEGIIIKLPKKRGLRDCSSYRGIMLLSTPGKVSTGFYWRGWRRLLTPSSETSRQASGGTHLVPTRSPACASLWNSYWSGTLPSTSTSKIMRRPLKVQTERQCGSYWDIMESPRR